MALLWNFRVKKKRTNQYPLKRNVIAAIPKINSKVNQTGK